jgi:hypothetical protein
MRKLTTLTITTLTLLGLAACTSDPEIVDNPPTTQAQDAGVTAGDTTDSGDTDDTTTEDEDAAPTVATANFGKTGYQYQDGLRVDISEGTEFTPSEWAAADDADLYLKYAVTITNDTDQTFDPSGFYTTLASGGAEMSEVFDDGLEAPSTPVMPGKAVTFNIGYPILDPDDVTMNVSVEPFERVDVLFTNR